jgi:hypothetical protein
MTLDHVKTKFMNLIDKSGSNGCWTWNGSVSNTGYGRIGVCPGRKQVHRLSWELFHGKIPDGLHVLHKCDNPLCVNPDHLFLGTQMDNNLDRTLKGRTASGDSNGMRRHPERVSRGERNGRAKITEEIVLEIRRLYVKGSRVYGQASLARKFGLSQPYVGDIVNRLKWRHI